MATARGSHRVIAGRRLRAEMPRGTWGTWGGARPHGELGGRGWGERTSCSTPCSAGIRLKPPTSSTACKSPGRSPESDMACLHAAPTRASKGWASASSSVRVRLHCRPASPTRQSIATLLCELALSVRRKRSHAWRSLTAARGCASASSPDCARNWAAKCTASASSSACAQREGGSARGGWRGLGQAA